MIPISNQLSLRQLEYFVAVAQHLHFRKAAESLYITQPGLSRQVKQMEKDLGIILFSRDNRKVSLTHAGHYMQEEVQRLLKSMHTIIDHARLIQEGLAGNLRFGYVGSAMQNAIPQLLLSIREIYPNILFDLKEMNNKDQIEALINDEIDLGFIRMETVPRGISSKLFYEDTFSLVVPRGHDINAKNYTSLDQLRDEQFILFESSYSESYYESVMRLFDEARFEPIISHSTVHASTIYRLIELGFGVSIVPTSLKLGYDMDVEFIELSESKERAILYLAHRKDNNSMILQNLKSSGIL
jgi:Transcriptional regulator